VLKFVKGPRLLGVVALVWLVATLPAVVASSWYFWVAGGLVAAVAGVAGRTWLQAKARMQVNHLYLPLGQVLAEAEGLCQTSRDQMAATYQRQVVRDQELHDAGLRQAEEKHQRRLAEITQRRDADAHQVEEKYQWYLGEITQRRDTE